MHLTCSLHLLSHVQPVEPMQPWYRGFRGNIVEVPTKGGGKSYSISGIAAWVRGGRGTLVAGRETPWRC